MVPVHIATRNKEQMTETALAVFPNNAEHYNSREGLPFGIFNSTLLLGNINQITEEPDLLLPSSSCSLSFSTESRSFGSSLSEHWAFLFFLGYSIQEIQGGEIKQVFVMCHREEKKSQGDSSEMETTWWHSERAVCRWSLEVCAEIFLSRLYCKLQSNECYSFWPTKFDSSTTLESSHFNSGYSVL